MSGMLINKDYVDFLILIIVISFFFILIIVTVMYVFVLSVYMLICNNDRLL